MQHGSQGDLALASSSGYTSDDEASTEGHLLPSGLSGIIDGKLSKDGAPPVFFSLACLRTVDALSWALLPCPELHSISFPGEDATAVS